MMEQIFTLLESSQYITEMLLACLLLIIPHQKRDRFPLRAGLFCLGAEAVSLLVMNLGTVAPLWQDPAYLILSCVVFTVVFAAVAVAFIALCCPVTGKELVYCVALSLCVQHFSSASQLLLRGLIPLEGPVFGLAVEVVTVPLCYLCFYRFGIRKMCENGSYQVDNLHLTAATCLVFLVAALASIAIKSMTPSPRDPLFLFCQVYEMLSCFFLMWIQVNQKQALDLQHEVDMQNYLQHLRHEQFQSSRQNQSLLTHLMHELKHQVADMISQEDGVERDDLLDQIGENLQVYDDWYQTKNETLNTALTERSLYCRQKQIQLLCVADCTHLDLLETGDLYLILRNGLDNAIEAVSRLEEIPRRFIDLKIYTRNDFLMIQMQNPYSGSLHFRSGLPLTTKADRRFHGFGLKTVQSLAQRYGGDLSITAKNGLFTFRVLLPMTPQNT